MTPARGGDFGGLLRRYRVAAGLSQETLAERAGLSAAGVAALERGRRTHPRAFTVSRLAEALQLEGPDRSALVDGRGGAPPPPALPRPPTTFVGREQELDELGERVGEARLVTLTGPGGMGKTRLAAELVTMLTGEGQHAGFVALDACRDPGLVPAAVAAALGFPEDPRRPGLDALLENLRSFDGLIVLDNCEHVREAVAAMVEQLLRGCPRLSLLATSRAVLGVAGELTWRVPSLRLPAPDAAPDPGALAGVEAVRLFLDRAALSDATFRLTDDNAAAVAAICRRLDGIPLAIELAAARVRVLAPAQILARLGDAAALLTGGVPSAPRRQRTLLATIEWSYQLLGASEQTLFDRLSLFAGGFDFEAAEAVAGDDALDALTGLVDQSLVVAEPGPGGQMRYRLLEVLRQHGRSRLERAGSPEVVAQRHAEHYLRLATSLDPDLRSGHRSRALPRLRLEHANFRAALEWASGRPGDLALRLATALGHYWDLGGSVTEGSIWLERALAAGTDDEGLRATALLHAGRLAVVRRDYPRAEACLSESPPEAAAGGRARGGPAAERNGRDRRRAWEPGGGQKPDGCRARRHGAEG